MLIALTVQKVIWILIGFALASFLLFCFYMALPLFKKWYRFNKRQRETFDMLNKWKEEGKTITYFTLNDFNEIEKELKEFIREEISKRGLIDEKEHTDNTER